MSFCELPERVVKPNPNFPSAETIAGMKNTIDDFLEGTTKGTWFDDLSPAHAIKYLRELNFQKSFSVDFKDAESVIYVSLFHKDYGGVGIFTEVKDGLCGGFALYAERGNFS